MEVSLSFREGSSAGLLLSLRRGSGAVLDLKSGWLEVSAVDSAVLCGCFHQDIEG